MDKNELRIHHLLCIPLFVGEGYSGAFCENMSRVIQRLNEKPDQRLTAVCRADMICSGCPNLTEKYHCRENNSRVEEKDRRLAKEMGIYPGRQYAYWELLQIAQANLTEEIFTASCQNCRWFLRGLCSYRQWRKNLQIVLDKVQKMC